MVDYMKAVGKMMKSMDLLPKFIQMVENMKDHFLKEKNMVKDNSNGY